jgi:hypothetical protein
MKSKTALSYHTHLWGFGYTPSFPLTTLIVQSSLGVGAASASSEPPMEAGPNVNFDCHASTTNLRAPQSKRQTAPELFLRHQTSSLTSRSWFLRLWFAAMVAAVAVAAAVLGFPAAQECCTGIFYPLALGGASLLA